MDQNQSDISHSTQPISLDQRLHRLVYLKIAIAVVVCIGLCLLIWFIHILYNGQRKITNNYFQQIYVALDTFNDKVYHLPFPVRREITGQPLTTLATNGTGRPLYSWRVDLVYCYESLGIEWNFERNQSWNSLNNKKIFELSHHYSYYEPSYSPDVSNINEESFPETNAMAIIGPGTVFGDGEETPKALTKDVSPGTILVVESRSSGISWPTPGDFDIRNMPQTINAPDGKGISSIHSGGFHVIFADGKVWFISDKVPFETLKKFFTIEDAKKYDREELLGPYVIDH